MRKGINFTCPRAQSFCTSTRQQTYESTAGALTARRHFIKKFMFPERLCLFYNLVSGSFLRVYWWQVSCFLMVDQSDLGTPKPCINKQMKIAELIKDKSSILWWAKCRNWTGAYIFIFQARSLASARRTRKVCHAREKGQPSLAREHPFITSVKKTVTELAWRAGSEIFSICKLVGKVTHIIIICAHAIIIIACASLVFREPYFWGLLRSFSISHVTV